MPSRPILTLACKARDLSATLAESLATLPNRRRARDQERARRAYHAKLEDALGYRWTLTEAGLRERLADDTESRFSAELDTRDEP